MADPKIKSDVQKLPKHNLKNLVFVLAFFAILGAFIFVTSIFISKENVESEFTVPLNSFSDSVPSLKENFENFENLDNEKKLGEYAKSFQANFQDFSNEIGKDVHKRLNELENLKASKLKAIRETQNKIKYINKHKYHNDENVLENFAQNIADDTLEHQSIQPEITSAKGQGSNEESPVFIEPEGVTKSELIAYNLLEVLH